MDIGQLIREYREKNSITQAQFGAIVGVNKQTVSKWEVGRLQPTTKKLFEIADAIGVSIYSICAAEQAGNNPLIFTRKKVYNVGLKCAYDLVNDFQTFGIFAFLFAEMHRLMNRHCESLGVFLLNRTLECKDSYEKAIPIKSVSWDYEYFSIEIEGASFSFEERDISQIESVGCFNNEAYVFNIYLKNERYGFFQLIFIISDSDAHSQTGGKR